MLRALILQKKFAQNLVPKISRTHTAADRGFSATVAPALNRTTKSNDRDDQPAKRAQSPSHDRLRRPQQVAVGRHRQEVARADEGVSSLNGAARPTVCGAPLLGKQSRVNLARALCTHQKDHLDGPEVALNAMPSSKLRGTARFGSGRER
jgi:hypothetical protein